MPSTSTDRKRKRSGNEEEDATSHPPGKKAMMNKNKVLVFSTRGITQRHRHLLEDLRTLLPHGRKDAKLDAKDRLNVVNEVCDLQGCNLTLFLEARKKTDLFMWLARTPFGPSIRFLVQNIHTMDELKMTGNCLRGSRPLLVFDKVFDTQPHLAMMKEMLMQIFCTPKSHRKSKPFVDHVFSFFYVDDRIWFRNFQIIEPQNKAEAAAAEGKPTLVEIGPRFVLQPIRIFGGSFGGPTLYENPNYASPNQLRLAVRQEKAGRFKQRVRKIRKREEYLQKHALQEDELADTFKE
eukprot:Rmarinus@m.19483